jgi:hypothetical protein
MCDDEDVTGDAGVFGLAGNFVDFINVHNASLGLGRVISAAWYKRNRMFSTSSPT